MRLSRRECLALLGGSTVAYAGRKVVSEAPLMAVQDFAQFPQVVTPGADFFTRDHFALPENCGDWMIEVDGEVAQPAKFRLGDLKALEQCNVGAVLECAGNDVGMGAVGYAAWQGPALASLLQECQPQSVARRVRFSGADRGREPDGTEEISYVRSIPLAKALDPDTLLALRMNGEPLTPEHGFPVRVVVPGAYGMDSVKWLRRIELIGGEDHSFFQRRRFLRWTDRGFVELGPMRVKSVIVRPRQGQAVRGELEIGGFAWAGPRTVKSVEVTADDGQTWRRATLLAPSRPYGWAPWSIRLRPGQPPGACRLAARAFDSAGGVQPAGRDPARRDEYELNHWHRVSVLYRP